MAEKYFCAHCDQEFVPETDDDKPRCPTCMRRGGVQVVPRPSVESGASSKKWFAVALVLVIAATAYGVYRSTAITLEATPPVRPLEPRELAAYLERDQIAVGKLEGMFALPASIDWPAEPEAVSSSIRGKSKSWALDHPLPREVMTADETLAALDAGKERVRLYPLEAAVAMTALLRGQGARAMVAEAWELGEQAPPDPSGLLGYFLVAVYDGDAQEPSGFFDPWGGRHDTSPSSVRVLRDTEAVAAGLGTDAARIFAKSGDSGQALPLVETALSLDPVSPPLRGVHATVLLETGGVAMGAAEFEAALQLRPDGPRQLNLIQLSLAQAAMLQMANEAAAADAQANEVSQSIAAVVAKWPGYSRAHLTLAMLHFAIDEADRARAELEIAERLQPGNATLWALWGQYYLMQGEFVSAAARVNHAIELDPENWQLRLQTARVLFEAGDEENARANVNAALEMVPAAKRDELKQYLARALGPGVFGDAAPSAPPSDDLVLPDPVLDDPSNLRLRDPNQGLQLDLDD